VAVESNDGEKVFHLKALSLRDALAERTSSYDALFAGEMALRFAFSDEAVG